MTVEDASKQCVHIGMQCAPRMHVQLYINLYAVIVRCVQALVVVIVYTSVHTDGRVKTSSLGMQYLIRMQMIIIIIRVSQLMTQPDISSIRYCCIAAPVLMEKGCWSGIVYAPPTRSCERNSKQAGKPPGHLINLVLCGLTDSVYQFKVVLTGTNHGY